LLQGSQKRERLFMALRLSLGVGATGFPKWGRPDDALAVFARPSISWKLPRPARVRPEARSSHCSGERPDCAWWSSARGLSARGRL